MDRLEDYKTVLIVGNGFDLNLNYPTSYSDFMKSKYFSDLVSNNDTLAKYLLHKRVNNGNWIDIENELANYSNILRHESSIFYDMPQELKAGKNPATIKNSFREEFIRLCTALKEYLNEIENAKKFNEGFNEFHAYKLIKDIVYERRHCYVVNFNYTIFLEKLIDVINYNYTEFYIRKIHGSLKHEIVFGVQDNLDLTRDHVFLYKSYNKYQEVKGLPHILGNADNIIFFGYSLGETDHSYFDDFFKNQTEKNCRSKNFVFYHYGQDAYDDIIWQLKALTNNRTSYLNQYNNIQFIDSSKAIK